MGYWIQLELETGYRRVDKATYVQTEQSCGFYNKARPGEPAKAHGFSKGRIWGTRSRPLNYQRRDKRSVYQLMAWEFRRDVEVAEDARYRALLVQSLGRGMERAIINATAKFHSEGPGRARLSKIHTAYRRKRA